MTLGQWRALSVAMFGDKGAATAFLLDKIDNSENGENEEVLADESQMLYLLNELQHRKDRTNV